MTSIRSRHWLFTPGNPPVLQLTVSHPVAEGKVRVSFIPEAVLGINGNLVTLNRELRLRLDDVL